MITDTCDKTGPPNNTGADEGPAYRFGTLSKTLEKGVRAAECACANGTLRLTPVLNVSVGGLAFRLKSPAANRNRCGQESALAANAPGACRMPRRDILEETDMRILTGEFLAMAGTGFRVAVPNGDLSVETNGMRYFRATVDAPEAPARQQLAVRLANRIPGVRALRPFASPRGD